MKFLKPPHPFRPRGEKRSTEMQRPFPLAEPGSRHDTDARPVEEAEAVELVGGFTGVLRGLDRFFGEIDEREKIHCALRDYDYY